MLDQRRRRWADVVQMLYKRFVFARIYKKSGIVNYCSMSLSDLLLSIHNWMASCTTGLTHILTILSVFWGLLPQALTDKRAKCLDQSHSVVQAKVCLRMMLFDDFHRAQNGLTLTSDQV